jgi:RNA polymerase sigma factor (sigma-70 family)
MKSMLFLWGAKTQTSKKTARTFSALHREYMHDVKKIASAFKAKYNRHIVTQDELEQEAWLGLLKALKSFDLSKGATFRTHALNCMRWAIQDHLKSVVRDSKYVDRSKDALEEREKHGTEDENCDSIQNDFLHQGLGKLSERQQEAIQLRFYCDQKLKDVAAGMDISIAAASKLVNTALRNLRSYMELQATTL